MKKTKRRVIKKINNLRREIMSYKKVDPSKCKRLLCNEQTPNPTYCSDRCSWLSPVEDENAELKERWDSLTRYLEDNAHLWYIGYSGPFDVALCEMKAMEQLK